MPRGNLGTIFNLDDIKPIFQVQLNFQDRHQEFVEITWERGQREFQPIYEGSWTGTTTFFLSNKPEENKTKTTGLKMDTPTHRIPKKVRIHGPEENEGIRLPLKIIEAENNQPEVELADN